MIKKIYRFVFIEHSGATFRTLYFLMFIFAFYTPLLIVEFVLGLLILCLALYGEKKGWNEF